MNKVTKKLMASTAFLSGNMIPIAWYTNIRTNITENNSEGKPDLIAISILSDIMYWYRPIGHRNKVTGQIDGYIQNFDADKLQKSYKFYGKLFGIPKRTIKKSFDLLVDNKIITREFRTVETKSGTFGNVMFVEPIIDKVMELSVIKFKDPLLHKLSNSSYSNSVIGLTQKVQDITENTTEITTGTDKDKSLSNCEADASQVRGDSVVYKNGIIKKIIKPSKDDSCTTKTSLPTKDRRRNNKSTKTKIAKSKLNKPYSNLDHQIYIRLRKLGSTKQIETKQSYFNTMDCIHELFDPKCKSPLLRANNFEEGLDEDWINQVDFFADVFKYQLKFNEKPIKNIKQFILFDSNIKKEPWSPLIMWGIRFEKGDDELSDGAEKLKKVLEKKFDKTIKELDLKHSALNNTAEFIVEMENTYTLNNPPRVKPSFAMTITVVEYIVEKKNSDNWEIHFINGKHFQDEFLKKMLKRNAFIKKSKSKRDLSKRCDS